MRTFFSAGSPKDWQIYLYGKALLFWGGMAVFLNYAKPKRLSSAPLVMLFP